MAERTSPNTSLSRGANVTDKLLKVYSFAIIQTENIKLSSGWQIRSQNLWTILCLYCSLYFTSLCDCYHNCTGKWTRPLHRCMMMGPWGEVTCPDPTWQLGESHVKLHLLDFQEFPWSLFPWSQPLSIYSWPCICIFNPFLLRSTFLNIFERISPSCSNDKSNSLGLKRRFYQLILSLFSQPLYAS